MGYAIVLLVVAVIFLYILVLGSVMRMDYDRETARNDILKLSAVVKSQSERISELQSTHRQIQALLPTIRDALKNITDFNKTY